MENTLIINDENKKDLLTAAKWGKFLAILGYFVTGIMILAGIAMTFGGAFLSSMFGKNDMPFPFAIIGIIYTLIGLGMLFLIHKSYKMCTGFKNAVNFNEQSDLNSGFSNMASYYKISGMITAFFIGLYALIIIGAICAALFFKSKVTTEFSKEEDSSIVDTSVMEDMIAADTTVVVK